jgi:uncharacterized protein involved in exopolysaccharide biosynthesis
MDMRNFFPAARKPTATKPAATKSVAREPVPRPKSAKLKEDVYEAAKLPVETTAEFVREKSDELKARRAALRARVQEHEQELRALQNSHDEEDESLETQQLLLVQAAQVAVGAISLATHQSLHLSVGFTYHLSI